MPEVPRISAAVLVISSRFKEVEAVAKDITKFVLVDPARA
jgi:hypothetical protein